MNTETHHERLSRLTKLARKEWPGKDVCVVATNTSAAVFENGEPHAHALVTIMVHPRALDALEAALSTLRLDCTQCERCDAGFGPAIVCRNCGMRPSRKDVGTP